MSRQMAASEALSSSNQDESLSGIETRGTGQERYVRDYVPIKMNPYQGLKHSGNVCDGACFASNVPIKMNPYQGLKQRQSGRTPKDYLVVPIKMNPYQGLKLPAVSSHVLMH